MGRKWHQAARPAPDAEPLEWDADGVIVGCHLAICDNGHACQVTPATFELQHDARSGRHVKRTTPPDCWACGLPLRQVSRATADRLVKQLATREALRRAS